MGQQLDMTNVRKRGTVQLLFPNGEVPLHGQTPTPNEALVARAEEKFKIKYKSVKEHYGSASVIPYGTRGNMCVDLRAVTRIDAAQGRWHYYWAESATAGACWPPVPTSNRLVASLVEFMGMPPSREAWSTAGPLPSPQQKAPSDHDENGAAVASNPVAINALTSVPSGVNASSLTVPSPANASAGNPPLGQQATAMAGKAVRHSTGMSGRDKRRQQRLESNACKEAKRAESSRTQLAAACPVTTEDQGEAASGATDDSEAGPSDSSSQQGHAAAGNTSVVAAGVAPSLLPASAATLHAPCTSQVAAALRAKLDASLACDRAAAGRAAAERRAALKEAVARRVAEQDAAAAQRAAARAACEAAQVAARNEKQVQNLKEAVASSRAEAAAAMEALQIQIRLDRRGPLAAAGSGGKGMRKGPSSPKSAAVAPAVGAKVTGCQAAMRLLASARRRARHEGRRAARRAAAAAAASAAAATAEAHVALFRRDDSANERDDEQEVGQQGAVGVQLQVAPAGPAEDLLAVRAPAAEGQRAIACFPSHPVIMVDE